MSEFISDAEGAAHDAEVVSDNGAAAAPDRASFEYTLEAAKARRASVDMKRQKLQALLADCDRMADEADAEVAEAQAALDSMGA